MSLVTKYRFQLFDNKSENYSVNYSFDYKVDFKKDGHHLELEVNYNKNDSPKNALYTIVNSTNNSFTTDVKTVEKNTIISLDCVNPFSETTKLQVRLEARDENTDDNLFLNNAYNSDLTYGKTLHSAYATFGKKMGKMEF